MIIQVLLQALFRFIFLLHLTILYFGVLYSLSSPASINSCICIVTVSISVTIPATFETTFTHSIVGVAAKMTMSWLTVTIGHLDISPLVTSSASTTVVTVGALS